MTTSWVVPQVWLGETVAILGNGAAMTKALADSLAGYKRVAVNRAVRFAPSADMFVALDPDPQHWAAAEGFSGLRVCGVECDIDALYAGMWYETVNMPGGARLHIRNNFLAAIRIAALAGASKILLAGVDAPLYDEIHAHTGFSGFTEGLAQITAELRAQGVEIEQVGAVPAVPMRTAEPDEALPSVPESAYPAGSALLADHEDGAA